MEYRNLGILGKRREGENVDALPDKAGFHQSVSETQVPHTTQTGLPCSQGEGIYLS